DERGNREAQKNLLTNPRVSGIGNALRGVPEPALYADFPKDKHAYRAGAGTARAQRAPPVPYSRRTTSVPCSRGDESTSPDGANGGQIPVYKRFFADSPHRWPPNLTDKLPPKSSFAMPFLFAFKPRLALLGERRQALLCVGKFQAAKVRLG